MEKGFKLPELPAVELSTAHITQHDSELLNETSESTRTGSRKAFPVAVDRYAYGYYIPIAWSEPLSDLAKEIKQKGGSQAFIDLLNLCIKQKVRLLVLDCDAPVAEGLPKFDW